MKKRVLAIFLLSIGYIYAQSPNFEWAAPLSGAGNEQGSCVALDPSGNVYTVGTFQSTVDFDPGAGVFNLTSAGDYDICLVKLDNNGNFIWAKSMGSTLTDYGYGIDVDNVGNIYITGRFTGTVDFDPNAGTSNLTSFGDGDVFIAKYTSAGNIVYAKQIGGPYLDEGHSLVVDANGNVYATGDFDIIADFDPSAVTYNLYGQSCTNLFVVKLNTDGNLVWAKNTSGPAQGFGIALDPAGFVITTGPFYNTMDFDPTAAIDNYTSWGAADIFLWKLDINGNYIWAKQMGSDNSGGGWDCGNAVTVDNNGNIYSTGYFIGDGDFDPGPSAYTLTSGNYDAYISKVDANGNFIWAKAIGGFNAQRGFSIAVDAVGSVYTVGDFIDVTDFDPGAGSFTIASTWSANSMFLHKLDASGNFIWVEQIGNNGIGYAVQVDDAYNIYVTGIYYYGTADFDPGAGIFNLTAAGGNDGLVYKMSQIGAGVTENNLASSVLTYPNPVFETIYIESPLDILHVELNNSAGERVITYLSIDGKKANVMVNQLPADMYFLQIETTKGWVTKKMVKE